MSTAKTPKAPKASTPKSADGGKKPEKAKGAGRPTFDIDTKVPLGAFLSSNKVEAGKLLRSSVAVESLSPADRILLEKRQAHRRKKAEGKETYQAASIGKPASGKPLTAQQLRHALAGADIATRVRGKIVRALRKALGDKGDKVTVDQVFGRPAKKAAPAGEAGAEAAAE